MFPVPPLFRIIAEESGAEWSEMYRVFNCGHRLEVYVSPEDAQSVIDLSRSFNIDAQVVGRIEEGPRSLTIRSEFGEFHYWLKFRMFIYDLTIYDLLFIYDGNYLRFHPNE